MSDYKIDINEEALSEFPEYRETIMTLPLATLNKIKEEGEAYLMVTVFELILKRLKSIKNEINDIEVVEVFNEQLIENYVELALKNAANKFITMINDETYND